MLVLICVLGAEHTTDIIRLCHRWLVIPTWFRVSNIPKLLNSIWLGRNCCLVFA
jgi:hypothetical protein